MRHGEGQGGDGQEVFPAVASIDAEPRFRAVTSKTGERRGIRLEGIYWDALSRLSAETGLSLSEVIDLAAGQLPDNGNLASWLRVLAVKWSMTRLTRTRKMSRQERGLMRCSGFADSNFGADKR